MRGIQRGKKIRWAPKMTRRLRARSSLTSRAFKSLLLGFLISPTVPSLGISTLWIPTIVARLTSHCECDCFENSRKGPVQA